MRRAAAATLAALLLAAGNVARAEPIFLSRQYVRCTGCHFSPTGGGLLTPYGRSLSREELSTFGKSRGASPSGREHEFLFGALGDSLRDVSVGLELWPAHRRGCGGIPLDGQLPDERRSHRCLAASELDRLR
jgi:hypothetical protein